MSKRFFAEKMEVCISPDRKTMGEVAARDFASASRSF